jgi:hypothetical protein
MDETQAVSIWGMDLGGWTLLAIAALYFVPLSVAIWRGHPKGMAIITLNVALGWTGIGWLGALVWALSGPDGRRSGGADPQAGDRGT